MNNKKFKILAIVDAILIVGLIVLMIALKDGYNKQAQSSVLEQETDYRDLAYSVTNEQWKSVDQFGMAWKLVFNTLKGNKTEASFNTLVKNIETDKMARIEQISGIYDAASGNPCLKIAQMRKSAGIPLPSVDEQRKEISAKCYGMPDEALAKEVAEKGLADKFLVSDAGGVKKIACGKNCEISFTFEKGMLKSSDYKALIEYNMADNFKLEAPAPFHFE